MLAAMEQRAASLRNSSDPAYWDALALLARLYEEGNQKDLATQKLKSMQDFLAGASRPAPLRPTGRPAKAGCYAVSVSPQNSLSS